MKVEIDEQSGFCFGVRDAVKQAEESLSSGEELFCLGKIVHNPEEVSRLENMGLHYIDYDEYRELKNTRVLIRAHGEPPETYKIAEENNLELIDASCKIVSKLQSRIKRALILNQQTDSQLVIFGKADHPEVRALQGHASGKAIIVRTLADLDLIDYQRPLTLFSQTTMNQVEFRQLIKKLEEKYIENGMDPGKYMAVNNTICRQVSCREPRLREFAGQHDMILFVSGRDSSNGKMLFEVVASENPNSWFISSADEIPQIKAGDAGSVGICGATSTPRWLMEEIRDSLLAMDN